MTTVDTLSRASGEPLVRGRIRSQPEDFLVVEEPSFEPSGQGEHVLVRVRKRGCNSAWVARRLAQMTGTRARDVGYAGRKDRWAICEQWFSVRMPLSQSVQAEQLCDREFTALEVIRHDRKIRTGALRGNRFEITVRGMEGEVSMLAERLTLLASQGVPNYFGEQRFGRNGDNIAAAEAMFSGQLRVSREQRSLYLSAARALLFNRVLDARVRGSNWNQALAGDRMMLDGSRSSFVCEQVDAVVMERLTDWDIHPSGPLWGRGEPLTIGDSRDLEDRVVDTNADLKDGLEQAGLRQERRALRVRVESLQWDQPEPESLRLSFRLPRGSYATAVLREFLETVKGGHTEG